MNTLLAAALFIFTGWLLTKTAGNYTLRHIDGIAGKGRSREVSAWCFLGLLVGSTSLLLLGLGAVVALIWAFQSTLDIVGSARHALILTAVYVAVAVVFNILLHKFTRKVRPHKPTK